MTDVYKLTDKLAVSERGVHCRRAVYRPLSAGASAILRLAVADPGRANGRAA